jgi:hypothetical protein
MNVFIERFIGTLQRECLDYHYEPLNAAELSEITDAWLDKYHFYRPHEAPDFLTPRHQYDGSVFRRCGSIHSNFGGCVLFIVSTQQFYFYKIYDKTERWDRE